MSQISLVQGGRTVDGQFQTYDKNTNTYKAPPPAARGNDFAGNFNQAGGPSVVQQTGGSIGQAIDVIGGGLSVAEAKIQNEAISAARTQSRQDRASGKNLATTSQTQSALAIPSTQDTLAGSSVSGTSQYSSSGSPVGGDAAATLDAAKKKALEIQQQVALLAQREKTSSSNITASDTPIVNNENAASAAIDSAKLSSPSDKSVQLLDTEIAKLSNDLKNQEKSINSSFDAQQTDLENKQNSETGQTSVAIANAGGYLGYSGSATGVMLSLASSHRAELQSLSAARDKAIADAEQASANRRWDIVQAKAAEIDRIDQETYNRQQDYNTKVQQAAAQDHAVAQNMADEKTIFNAIQTGSKTPEEIYKSLDGAIPIEQINKFLDGIAPSASPSDSFKFSPTDTSSLLGAGLSQQDIQALHDTVNQLGYTQEVRDALPVTVRAVADKIYGLKTGTGSSSGATYNIGGRDVSSTTLQVLDGFTHIDNLTPTMQAKVKDDLFALGFGSDTPPSWFNDSFVSSLIGQPIDQALFNTSVPQTIYHGQNGPFGDTYTLSDYDKAKIKADYIQKQWTATKTKALETTKKNATNPADSISYDSIPQ